MWHEPAVGVEVEGLELGSGSDEMGGEVQVLDGGGEFKEAALEALLEEYGVCREDPGFNVVAIVGPQSSGKSTVLNEAFGTGFETMDAEKGRYQVTQGVWSSVCELEGRQVVVLDVEGCDSSERGNDGFALERRLALFMLVVSDVLIVNMWSSDVGRRNASNMTLLRSVIQLQLSLFGSDEEFRRRPLKLMFLLRDYDGQTPTDKVESRLRSQVREIFEELGGDDGLELHLPDGSELALGDIVEQSFVFLPHRTFRPSEFRATARQLRRSMVLPESYCREVAGRDFVMFAGGVWETIRNDNKLDVPAQRDLLSLYRCGRTADRLRLQAYDRLHELSTRFKKGTFSEKSVFLAVTNVVEDTLLDFCLDVFGYSKRVVEEKSAELVAELLPAALPAFEAGVSDAKRRSTRVLRDIMDRVSSETAPWNTFAEEADAGRRGALESFNEWCALDGSERYASWTRVVDAEAERLQDDLDVVVLVAREDVLRRAKVELEARMLEAVIPPLETLVARAELDLWEHATELCRAQWASLAPQVEAALTNLGVEDKDEMFVRIRSGLRLAIIERIRAMIGPNSVFFNRLAVSFREALPENWLNQNNTTTLLAEARSRALENLLLLAVIRIGNLGGGIEPAVEHFTQVERDDLMHDIERMEMQLVRNARAEQFQRNVRITEVVVSTATVIGMAVATAALGVSRRG